MSAMGDSSQRSLNQSQLNTMDDCEKTYQQLKQIQQSLAKKPTTTVSTSEADKIWQTKLAMILAETTVREKTTPQVLKDVDVYDCLVSELQASIDYLTDTLPTLKEEQNTCGQLIAREDEMKRIHSAVKEKLEDRLVQMEQGSLSFDEQKAIHDFNLQCKNAKKLRKALQLKLKAFVDKHFPQNGTEANFRKESVQIPDSDKYLSLLAILDVLVNRTFDQPHDPYLTLDDTHWPPYIELLKHGGIIVTHPQDAHRIRLTSYHL